MSAREISGPVRFGVLGCADIAWRRTGPALVASTAVEVVAVASRTRARAETFSERFGCAAVVGYQELLDRDDVDAVYIPLPAMLHEEWIRRALEAGKHVLAEKPLAPNARLASELFHLARQRGLLLFENFMFLHHSQHETIRTMVAGGAIGELRSFSSDFTIPPKPADDIRYDPRIGGGALLDVGVYPIRAAANFLGPDLDVVGAVLRHDSRRDVVISGSILLTNPTGVCAQLGFGMEHSYRASYELFGSVGRLAVDRAFNPPTSHQPIVRVERQNCSEQLMQPADDQFGNVITLFTQTLRTGTDLDSYAEASVRHARLVDAIMAAATIVKF